MAPGPGGVSFQCENGIAVLTIDRPRTRNAIGMATAVELEEAIEAIAELPDAVVMVIRGAGDRVFISGGDLKELQTIRTEDEAVGMATRMRRTLDLIASFPLPVIAVLNGHALGGGAEVAVAADVRIAADDVRIGFTQTTLGIMPAWGGTERLVEIVGRSQALLLITTGAQLNAQQAKDAGLIDIVTKREDFETEWFSLAQQFASRGKKVSRAVKGVIRDAKPHLHRGLEVASVNAFAGLWVDDHHWNLAAEAMKR